MRLRCGQTHLDHCTRVKELLLVRRHVPLAEQQGCGDKRQPEYRKARERFRLAVETAGSNLGMASRPRAHEGM